MRRAKYTKQVTVMLDPAVYEQIRRKTDEDEISIGEWIREALDKALEREGDQADDK
jgi:predicted HicB family RNase H-like nuclease